MYSSTRPTVTPSAYPSQSCKSYARRGVTTPTCCWYSSTLACRLSPPLTRGDTTHDIALVPRRVAPQWARCVALWRSVAVRRGASPPLLRCTARNPPAFSSVAMRQCHKPRVAMCRVHPTRLCCGVLRATLLSTRLSCPCLCPQIVTVRPVARFWWGGDVPLYRCATESPLWAFKSLLRKSLV